MVWWIWLIAALVLGFIEVLTITFILLWIAIAAFVTALFAPFLHNFGVQVLLFALVSVILLYLTRGISREWRSKRRYPDRRETLIGQSGVVVRKTEPGGYALVRIQGDVWTARSTDVLDVGLNVTVVDATATIVTVSRTE